MTDKSSFEICQEKIMDVAKDVQALQARLCDALDCYAPDIKKQMAKIVYQTQSICISMSTRAKADQVNSASKTISEALIELVSAAEKLDQAYTVLGAVVDNE